MHSDSGSLGAVELLISRLELLIDVVEREMLQEL